MSLDINGKVALVTGANRGIGKALVAGLIGAGIAKVYAAVRDPNKAKPLVDQYGSKVVPIELDLTRPDTVTAAASKCQGCFCGGQQCGRSEDDIGSLRRSFRESEV